MVVHAPLLRGRQQVVEEGQQQRLAGAWWTGDQDALALQLYALAFAAGDLADLEYVLWAS